MPGTPRPTEAVLAGIARALDADPHNADLRAHLGELLLASDRTQDALEQAVRVLDADPAHAVALKVASLACRRNGDEMRAKSYERRADAMAPPPAAFDGTGGRSHVADPTGSSATTDPSARHLDGGSTQQVPDSAEALFALWKDMPGAAEGGAES